MSEEELSEKEKRTRSNEVLKKLLQTQLPMSAESQQPEVDERIQSIPSDLTPSQRELLLELLPEYPNSSAESLAKHVRYL